MKQLLLLCTLTIALNLNAQDNNSFSFIYNHLALSVKDVNRSSEFYKTVMNLAEIVNRTKMEGIRWFSLNEGKELHLVSIVPGEIKINKAVHLALTCKNFDAFIKHLSSKNISYSDWPGTPNKITLRADGVQQIYLQDPDGYWIEVNTPTQN
jgi:catechol 2,3-dioxygenase-like lactoylglutathione lyase family enzyme